MTRSPGFIALISVLIMSALALLLGIGVLTRAFEESSIQDAQWYAARAEAAATYCAEAALMKLKSSQTYAGNETLIMNGDTCRIRAVGGSGNSNRTIQATSTVMGANRNIAITVQQIDPVLQVSSWQDVANF